MGFLAAEFLRLVWLTNRFSFDPPNIYQRVEPQMPAICAFTPHLNGDWGVTDPVLSARDQANPRRDELPAGRQPYLGLRT